MFQLLSSTFLFIIRKYEEAVKFSLLKKKKNVYMYFFTLIVEEALNAT